jgi:hypothetical protein
MLIDGVKVAENLSSITIEQYVEFTKVQDLQENELAYHLIKIFTDAKDPREIPYQTAGRIVEHLVAVLDSKPTFVQKFTHKGRKYGFIPNLQKMSMGEFVDIDNSLGDWSKLSRLMSVLYRPITEEGSGLYRIEKYEHTHEEFNDLPVSIAAGAQVFFWTIAKDLLTVLKSSLESQTQTPYKTSHQEHNTAKNMAGLLQSIHSLEESLQSGRPSLLYPQRYAS